MLAKNREYQYNAELILKKSHMLNNDDQPKDDNVNWLFLKFGVQQFSFVYYIHEPSQAIFGEVFTASLSFTMIEEVRQRIDYNIWHDVFRGEEEIGMVRLLKNLMD